MSSQLTLNLSSVMQKHGAYEPRFYYCQKVPFVSGFCHS